MKSVIEELYFGNIRADGRIYANHPQFIRAAKRKCECLDELRATLNESTKEIFDTYCEAAGEIEDITRFDLFSYGLNLGIRLMTEILYEIGPDPE